MSGVQRHAIYRNSRDRFRASKAAQSRRGKHKRCFPRTPSALVRSEERLNRRGGSGCCGFLDFPHAAEGILAKSPLGLRCGLHGSRRGSMERVGWLLCWMMVGLQCPRHEGAEGDGIGDPGNPRSYHAGASQLPTRENGSKTPYQGVSVSSLMKASMRLRPSMQCSMEQA